MDWITSGDRLPPDTLGNSTLWLCDEERHVFEGGYLKYGLDEPVEDGEFIGPDGGPVEVSVAYWRPKQAGEILAPPPPPA